MSCPTPLEQMLRATTVARQAVIGLPASSSPMEHRFPFTPEGAGMLVAKGFKVRMEEGAARHIHYSDQAYTRCGVEIVSRADALAADIVVYLPAIEPHEASRLKRGALLLTFMKGSDVSRSTLKILLERNIIALDLLQVRDHADNRPFRDILQEIAGRASISVAASLLADAIHGKGILLGGVAGVVPCEVMVIGSDMSACAAAQTAMGLGATVRMFDNDIYRLREALRTLGPGVIGSTIHPRVFSSALRSADIVVASETENTSSVIGCDMVDVMKRGVICFDLTATPGAAFPSMQVVDLDLASPSDNDPTEPTRMCYINAGNAVPRTVAMALSNTFTTLLDDIMVCDGVTNALKLNSGLRSAVLTFLGKCVSADIARKTGQRHVDINLLIQFS
ncbi:MAG: hypothetical protein K2F99_08230 [Muribaculaceae bacterium]|nr:hypothetical protein [Muribaculaceae bacterium]